MNSSKNILFTIFLIFSLISFSFSKGCKYQQTKDGNEELTDSDYLKGYDDEKEEDKKKQACFSLSFSKVFDQVCCYDKEKNECTDEAGGENDNIICPQETKIPNNCGLAGMYQPETKEACTEIGLVKGYCCYVDFGAYGKACIKTIELNEDKNSMTEMISDYINKYRNENKISLTAGSVECKGFHLKSVLNLLIVGLLFLL